MLVCVFTFVVFSSCVDIVTEIEVNDDGSGTVVFTYTALRALINMGTVDDENRFYAVPISQEDFRATAERIDGITLRSFALEDDVDTVVVEAALDFDSPESLSDLFSSSGPGSVEISVDDDTTVYRQLIYGGAEEEIDQDSREFIETFFSDYLVTFTLEAPRAISAVNLGDFAGRVARFEMPMTEVLLSESQLAWEVRW